LSLFVFSCTVLFVSISQVIGCEDRLRNDLYCVGWGVKLYSKLKPKPKAGSCAASVTGGRRQSRSAVSGALLEPRGPIYTISYDLS